MNTKKPLIIITGPTAVGKTAFSIELAKKIGGEIISADSMQVYRNMDIGSAKITKEEMNGVPHHLIDILDPKEEFNVFSFQEAAQKCMEEIIYPAGHIPIIVGGTGFYIQSVLYHIDFSRDEQEPGTDPEYRNKLEEIVAGENGTELLHKMLREVDPEYADIIPANNVRRVMRGLEFYHLSGNKLSAHNEEQREKESEYNFVYFVLTKERETLYRRIGKRVDEMVEQGLFDEVARLKEYGCTPDMVSMKGIGYREVLEYLNSEKPDYEGTIEKIKINTRHFAKRQMTWFRREKDVTWMDCDRLDTTEKLLKEALRICREKEVIEIEQ